MRIGVVVFALATAGIELTGCGLMRPARVAEPMPVVSAVNAPEGTAATPLQAVTQPLPGESALGSSVASLGDPTLGGFWVRTALVTQPVKGRVVNTRSGASVQVDLLPMEKQGGGVQMSLAAMRLLTPTLTDQPNVILFES
ncbi:MAG TPA: hypothetical protein VGC31_08635 [Paenirhodobacter sp.]